MRRLLGLSVVVSAVLSLGMAGSAAATPSPAAPSQPAASNETAAARGQVFKGLRAAGDRERCRGAFALVTLLSGDYEPLLLTIAAGALIASSAENLLITMTEAIATSRKARSHRPHAEKPVGTSTTAITSSPIIATPSARE